MSARNKKVVHRFFEEVWNQGRVDLIKERVAADYVGHALSEIRGPTGTRQFVAALRTAFPDTHYTIDDELADGDRVVHRWTMRGTHEGPFRGIPATGKEVALTGISIYRVADGKLVEGWTSADMLALLHQLGVRAVEA
jgi:steroid delta-isomerase-like uncharacterized protein